MYMCVCLYILYVYVCAYVCVSADVMYSQLCWWCVCGGVAALHSTTHYPDRECVICLFADNPSPWSLHSGVQVLALTLGYKSVDTRWFQSFRRLAWRCYY